MDHTFFPNTLLKHQDQSERDREEKEAQLSEANKPLLENEFEEEVIMRFIRNPEKYKSVLDKYEVLSYESLKMALKLRYHNEEKERYKKQRKIFGLVLTCLIFVISIVVVVVSYSLECLTLGCGSLAFFLTLLNYVQDIMKSANPYWAKMVRNMTLVLCIALFLFLAFYNNGEDDKFMIDLSQSLLAMSVGFFVGLVIIKPLTKCGQEE